MLIDVRQALRSKLNSKADRIPSFVISYLKRIIHQDELNEILTIYKDLDGVDFMVAVVDYFNIKLIMKNEDHLPQDGRKSIFVSNHPLGGLDGICLSALIGKRYNKQIRYLVNDLLLQVPNLQSIFVPINKHGSQSKDAAKAMNEVYSSDNQILTFPAGLCSRKIKGRIIDLEWKKSFIQKSIEYKRDIVPIYFEARNSVFFYRLANIRKSLGVKLNIEMLYLPDEMFKNKNNTFTVTIGQPVSWEKFCSEKKPVEWAQWMKEEVYKLGN
jgi:putative hemolysin